MKIIRDKEIIRDKDITYYSEEELRKMSDVDIAYLLVATDTKLLQQNKNRGKLSICLTKLKNLIESIEDKSLIQREHSHTPTRDAFYVLEATKYYVPPRTAEEAKRPFIFSREFKKEIDDIFRD